MEGSQSKSADEILNQIKTLLSDWSKFAKTHESEAVKNGAVSELHDLYSETTKYVGRPLHLLVIDRLILLCHQPKDCTVKDVTLVNTILDELFELNRKGFEKEPPLEYAEKKREELKLEEQKIPFATRQIRPSEALRKVIAHLELSVEWKERLVRLNRRPKYITVAQDE